MDMIGGNCLQIVAQPLSWIQKVIGQMMYYEKIPVAQLLYGARKYKRAFINPDPVKALLPHDFKYSPVQSEGSGAKLCLHLNLGDYRKSIHVIIWIDDSDSVPKMVQCFSPGFTGPTMRRTNIEDFQVISIQQPVFLDRMRRLLHPETFLMAEAD